MQLSPAKVVVIGDSRHTDMLGAWLVGCLKVNLFASIRILVAIAGLPVLPSITLGATVTTVTTFNPENVSRSNYIDSAALDPDVCVQHHTSAIVAATAVFV